MKKNFDYENFSNSFAKIIACKRFNSVIEFNKVNFKKLLKLIKLLVNC